MAEKLSLLLNFLRQLGPVRLVIGAAATLAFFILMAIYLYKISPSDMVVLYSDLDNADSSKIVSELDARGVGRFFEKLIASGQAGGPEFLSTHPNPDNRVEAINNKWKELGSNVGGTFP